MGGKGSGRPTKTETLNRSLSIQKQTPIARDMFLPNLSGDLSRGKVIATPTQDLNPVNKKYVDDNFAAAAHTHLLAAGATDVTSSATELNVLNGIPATLTATEIGYCDGVTSAIQTQINNAVNNNIFNGRLTLTSGTPVTTSDVTAAATIYLTAYEGNKIALYDGTNWNYHTLTEISIAVTNAANTNYDIFVYNNAGTLTLESLAWTNDTTRATALAFQDGVYVKSGATTRRYVGSYRTTGTAGQTEDSKTNRFLWNFYNRVNRLLECVETTGHFYNGALRKWNNADTNNLLKFIIGVADTLRYGLNSALLAGAAGKIALARVRINGLDDPDDKNEGFNYNTGYCTCFSCRPTATAAGYNYCQIWEYGDDAGCYFAWMVMNVELKN